MSKRIWNPDAQRTAIQINSVTEMLFNDGIACAFNRVPTPRDQDQRCQITWFNHVPDRANSGRSFTKLNQYKHILETNSYHCLLFDGSIIRANFIFENDLLLTENLLWWPAPFDFSELLGEGFSPIEILLDMFGDSKWYESLKMRSPLRIDFDSENNTINHPHSHMHIQNEETRIFTSKPICFSHFMDFVLRNFYPSCRWEINKYDFIKYKTPEISDLDFTVSKMII